VVWSTIAFVEIILPYLKIEKRENKENYQKPVDSIIPEYNANLFKG